MSGAQRSIARQVNLGSQDDRATCAGAGSQPSAGAAAAAQWLQARRLPPTQTLRWHVEIAMDVVDGPAPQDYDDRVATRFHIDLYSEEWGVFFCHAGRSSWIRVTDIAFVHGRDDFGLLILVPTLKEIGALLRELEQRHGVHLQRQDALIRTNLVQAEPAIRRWLAQL